MCTDALLPHLIVFRCIAAVAADLLTLGTALSDKLLSALLSLLHCYVASVRQTVLIALSHLLYRRIVLSNTCLAALAVCLLDEDAGCVQLSEFIIDKCV